MKWIINYPPNTQTDYPVVEASGKEEAVDKFVKEFLEDNKGHYDAVAIKDAIKNGINLTPEEIIFPRICYVVPFCLPNQVKDFRSHFLFLLNEIEGLYNRKGKITNEYLVKVYQLTGILQDLYEFYQLKSILHIRLLAEKLLDHSPNQAWWEFDHTYVSIKNLLREAFLTETP